MSYVKNKNKKTGITYVYESESYWDKEKKQPRARRKLIGKIDEETGEIIPTGGRGRKPKDQKETEEAEDLPDYEAMLEERDARIEELTRENSQLRQELDAVTHDLEDILERCKTQEQADETENDAIRDRDDKRRIADDTGTFPDDDPQIPEESCQE